MNLAVDPIRDLDRDVDRNLDRDLARDLDLDQIRARVAPTVLAREQTMPVSADLAELFAERALVRGRTLACTGPAATSTAMALVSASVIAGSWLAVVDVPTFGLDAASEAGIPLERVVAVATDSPTSGWVEVMAAAVDGFDIVLSRQPSPSQSQSPSPSETAMRRLSTRIRQRGAVVVLIDDRNGGDTGLQGVGLQGVGLQCAELQCDGVVETSVVSWSGLGSGYGHLEQRTLDLSTSGRRLPGRRQCRLVGVRDDVA
jgi:hypothetical protein